MGRRLMTTLEYAAHRGWTAHQVQILLQEHRLVLINVERRSSFKTTRRTYIDAKESDAVLSRGNALGGLRRE